MASTRGGNRAEVSEIIRRYYFESLGQHLTLPPFLEVQRTDIEAQLKPIIVPEPKRTSQRYRTKIKKES